jgi:hypothetical protein
MAYRSDRRVSTPPIEVNSGRRARSSELLSLPPPYSRKCEVIFSSETGEAHSDQSLAPHTFTCRYKYDPRKKTVGKTLQKDPRPATQPAGAAADAADAPSPATAAPPAAGAAAPAAAAAAGAAAATDQAPAKKPRFDAKKSYEALEQEVQSLKATVSTLQATMSTVLAKLGRIKE